MRKDVCILRPIITPSHTAVIFADGSANNIGATIGTTTTAISIKSRKNPRIKISTIHGVKGNERENVVVTTDLAGAAFDEYQKNSDDMNRLFYVACTRTERNLYIIEPQTRKAYNL